MADPISLESLLCTETDNMCFDDLEATDDLDHPLVFCNLVGGGSEPLIGLIPMQSDEVLFLLFEKESEFLPRSDFLQRLRSGDLDLCVRNEALAWIHKANAHYNFGAPTACLAINYLDRFLSVYEFPRENNWSIQLLAVACLSLAAKLEEIKVPLTVDMQVAYPKFIFQAKTIKRMELIVLSTLKWRMQACTPFSFIDYFLRKIKSEDVLPSGSLMYGSLVKKSIQFILNTMKGIDFLEFRPSEISAAVAICVTRETEEVDIDKAMSGIIHFEKVRILKCVEMIKGLMLIAEASDVANGAVAAAQPVPQSPIGVLDAACLSYKSDERTVVSGPSSTQISQDTKRRKLD